MADPHGAGRDTCALEQAGEGAAPLAIYFPSGYQPAPDDGCRWEVYTKDGGRRPERCVVGRLPQVDLVGHTRDPTAGPLPCRYALGVLDRASGTLRYSAIEGGRVVRMEPRVRSLDYGPTGDGAGEEPLGRLEQAQQKRRLVDAFGSMRRKKRQSAAQNAAVHAGAVEGAAAVQSMLAELQAKAEADGTARESVLAEVQRSRPLPPHHPEATTPQDAYRLTELIPPAAWGSIDTAPLRKGATSKAFREGELVESGEVHEYVLQRLEMLAIVADTADERLKAAAYLSVLLKLHRLPFSLKQSLATGGLRGLAETHAMQPELLEAALEQFYEPKRLAGGDTSHALSAGSKGLLLLHILLLALALEGWLLEPSSAEALKKALQLKPATLTSAFRELGCVVKTSRRGGTPATQVALLPPVQPPKTLAESFPPIKAGNARGGRR